MTIEPHTEVLPPVKRKVHPNSLKNLKPSKIGEVRNPGGKPKGFDTLIRERTGGGLKLANMLCDIAEGGRLDGEPVKTSDRLRAAEILLERGWGKVKDQIELSGNAENPVALLVAAVRKEFNAQ